MMRRPIGYFVHHQGRGHAERAAAIVNALPCDQPVTLFSARSDIFPALASHVEVVRIPSLFETDVPDPPGSTSVRTPPTLHCAPLGWSGITEAVAAITRWFGDAQPALFVTDVSAEVAQLARIASVPCVPVLQHGDRDDAGHMAAYESAIGILAPYAAAIEQPGRPAWMQERIFHAGGLGVDATAPDRNSARARLGLARDADIVVVVGGGGGDGLPVPPLTLGARGEPDTQWFTIGAVAHAWHQTAPPNLMHKGWVDNPADWIAAADRVVSSAGNTTVHMIAAAARPWIVVPEWRYFDEQHWKALMLEAVGAAVRCDRWPASVDGWREAWTRAETLDPERQRMLIDPRAAAATAEWLDGLIATFWGEARWRPVPILIEDVHE
jgi:hypothetical protein